MSQQYTTIHLDALRTHMQPAGGFFFCFFFCHWLCDSQEEYEMLAVNVASKHSRYNKLWLKILYGMSNLTVFATQDSLTETAATLPPNPCHTAGRSAWKTQFTDNRLHRSIILYSYSHGYKINAYIHKIYRWESKIKYTCTHKNLQVGKQINTSKIVVCFCCYSCFVACIHKKLQVGKQINTSKFVVCFCCYSCLVALWQTGMKFINWPHSSHISNLTVTNWQCCQHIYIYIYIYMSFNVFTFLSLCEGQGHWN